MSKFKHNLTQGTFERMALVHPNIQTPRDLIDSKVEQMDGINLQNTIKLDENFRLGEISEYWKKKNPYLIEPNTMKSCDYPDIKSELESYNSGESPMPQLPEISESMYTRLAQHFRTLPERKIEESFKLVKTFYILKNYYLTQNIMYVSYTDFLNHANIVYHGYHNKQTQTELKMLQSYGDDIKMHLVNPSGTVRIFEVFQQILVTNHFKEYSYYPKLSPDAGDLIVKDNSLKSYGVGELKSGSLPQNSIIKLFTKMGPKYAELNHIHIYMDGDKNYIEQTIKDAKLEIPKNFQLRYINTEKVFSELYEVKHPMDIQFDYYYTQYMEVYDYIEHQILLGNGKKPYKIFFDKMAQESNSLDSNKKINLTKFYSHFSTRYDLDWLDSIKNVDSKLIDTDLDDISDNN